MRRRFNTSQVAQGGVEVNEFNQPVGRLARFHARVSHDEGDSGVAFEISVLAPRRVITKLPAVVAP